MSFNQILWCKHCKYEKLCIFSHMNIGITYYQDHNKPPFKQHQSFRFYVVIYTLQLAKLSIIKTKTT